MVRRSSLAAPTAAPREFSGFCNRFLTRKSAESSKPQSSVTPLTTIFHKPLQRISAIRPEADRQTRYNREVIGNIRTAPHSPKPPPTAKSIFTDQSQSQNQTLPAASTRSGTATMGSSDRSRRFDRHRSRHACSNGRPAPPAKAERAGVVSPRNQE